MGATAEYPAAVILDCTYAHAFAGGRVFYSKAQLEIDLKSPNTI